MSSPTLYIFSGLPGAGKSTLAKRLAAELGAAYLRMDSIEQGLRTLFAPRKIETEGYQLAYLLAKDLLTSRCDVVADSVNPLSVTRDAWMDVAQKSGAKFINIEIVCSDPHEHRERVENRQTEVVNLRLPTWHEVESRDYQNWTLPRLRIDTASQSVDESFRNLMKAISSWPSEVIKAEFS